MRTIKLERLTLRNFKGIKELVVNFQDCTNIKGDNATGKSTIFDAFTWLMFDKDSNDRQNFQIKTLDCNNAVIHGLEHEVTGVLSIDGKIITLTKALKERWTKKKGEAKRLLTSHETLYYVNEIPVKQSEYKESIAQIINEQLFKLISNPLYFSTNMKWQDRRNLLMELIGDIQKEKVLRSKRELSALVPFLKDIEISALRKSIDAKKRKLNESIKSIPYRIDELNYSIEEYNFKSVERDVQKHEVILRAVEEKLLDKSNMNEVALREKSRLYELKGKLKDIEYKAKSESQLSLRKLYFKLTEYEREINKNANLAGKLEYNIQNLECQIKHLSKQCEDLKRKWYLVQEKSLDIPEDNFVCPTCKRIFEPEEIESRKKELEESFNANKANTLAGINILVKIKKDEIEKLKVEVESSKEDLELYNRKIVELKCKRSELEEKINIFMPSVEFQNNLEYQEIRKEALELEKRFSKPFDESNEIAELRVQKVELAEKLDACKKKLALKDQNQKFRHRIDELMIEEKKLAKQITELDEQEFLCEEFIKTKMELLESSINKKFQFVNFKLFNTLVNGTVDDCCEVLINGVPFADANTASQINAGLDIINALCEHYAIQAPIFIDNRESINEIIACKSQIINLWVSSDKRLIVD